MWPGSLPLNAQPAEISAAAAGFRALNALAPTPNYISRLKSRRNAWKKFPVRVYFVVDEYHAGAREQMARHGFNRWAIATDGLIDYVVTEDSEAADIYVRFDPKTDNGLTQIGLDKHKIRRAFIMIGVRQGAQTDVETIASHEFGHALGIDGHSESKRDLMYPIHWAGSPGRLTSRDVNTLAARYPSLAKALDAKHTAYVR